MWKNRACAVRTTQPSNHGLDGGMESGKYRLRNGKIFFFATMDFFSQKNRHKITTVRKPEPGGKSEWTDEPKNISARKGQVSFLQQVSLCFFDTQSATKLGMPLVTTDFTFSLYLVRGITLILTDLICRHSATGWLQMLPLNIVCQQL